MNAEFYTGNRKKFLEKLDEGSVVLLHSGILPVKSNDQNMHPFSVNRNFYYLTGARPVALSCGGVRVAGADQDRHRLR